MSGLEREELISRIKGLGDEEMEIVVNLIPSSLILRRIANDLGNLDDIKRGVLMLQKECGEV